MRQKVTDFLNVDLGRLNIAGWILMLSSLALVVGGIVLFAAVAEGGGAAGPASLPRWFAYLSWVAAALFFFGGRWGLESLGIGTYRHPREAKPRRELARDLVLPQVEHLSGSMSAGGRMVLGIACSLIAAAFLVLGALYGDYFPKGAWPFYGLAAFCAFIALACLAPRSRPVALRVIGLAVFVAFACYVFGSYGRPDFWRALAGFGVFGLPAGYVALVGKYHRWGRLARVFGASPAREEVREE